MAVENRLYGDEDTYTFARESYQYMFKIETLSNLRWKLYVDHIMIFDTYEEESDFTPRTPD